MTTIKKIYCLMNPLLKDIKVLKFQSEAECLNVICSPYCACVCEVSEVLAHQGVTCVSNVTVSCPCYLSRAYSEVGPVSRCVSHYAPFPGSVPTVSQCQDPSHSHIDPNQDYVTNPRPVLKSHIGVFSPPLSQPCATSVVVTVLTPEQELQTKVVPKLQGFGV